MRYKCHCLLFILLSAGLPVHSHERGHLSVPPWQQATAWPDRVIVTIEKDPAHSFSVNWRTDQTVGTAIAQIAKGLPDARFDLGANSHRADTQQVELNMWEGPHGEVAFINNQGLDPVHYHSVTFDDLEPDTWYAYRVRGERGKWSPWRQVRTAPEDKTVQFLFFGDAQTGIRSHVTRTFDSAARMAPNARFAIHGGDLVNTASYDMEWAEWFASGGRTFSTIPSLPVPGNHDYINFKKDTKLFISERAVTPLWRPQFTLPVESKLPDALHETVYDIRYTENLHIFAIDSSGIAFEEQMKWLAWELEESDATWKVVIMHHPLFSFVGGTEHPRAKELRYLLLNVLENNDIDLVLTGHRHTYQRAESGDNVARISAGSTHKIETVFVVTASSTKRGDTKIEGWDRYRDEMDGEFNLVRYGNKVPIYAVVDVNGSILQYRAYDPLGNLYDSFNLLKDASGLKTITNGEAAFGKVYDGDNLAPYIGWDDLR